MNWYSKFKNNNPIFSFLALFLTIAIVMFGFFFLNVLRPLSRMKQRMNNTEVSWEEIKNQIVKINYGDREERVIELLGEPDEVFETPDVKVLSYRKYGLYNPTFHYDVEMREDTLYQIIAHD